jgi:hypothetical protein
VTSNIALRESGGATSTRFFHTATAICLPFLSTHMLPASARRAHVETDGTESVIRVGDARILRCKALIGIGLILTRLDREAEAPPPHEFKGLS